MDAIALLKADHDKVKELLTRLEDTTERAVKTRAELFATIKGELTVHEIIEEEIFYPELKAHPKAKDIVLEGFEEHHVVDLLMGELEALPVEDDTEQRELAAQIRAGDVSPGALRRVKADVEARLRIASPRYLEGYREAAAE